jgi:hypothetical protein
MSAFVGGTDMPWHQVDRIYCPPGRMSHARRVTEAPDDFPIHESPILQEEILVMAKFDFDVPSIWPGIRL